MSSRPDLGFSLKAFLKYWQLKRQGYAARPDKLPRLNQAKNKFLHTVPKSINAQALLKKWERQFHDINTRHHHQGG